MNIWDEWAYARASFSHDWLQNEFMQSVGSSVKICRGAAGTVDVEKLLKELQGKILDVWHQHTECCGKNDLKKASFSADPPPGPQMLLDTCIDIMSPRNLFMVPPLSRLDEADYHKLSELAHNLWLERYNIQDSINSAQADLNAVETSVCEFSTDYAYILETGDLTRCCKRLENIYYACESLSISFSKLPSRILI